MPKAFRRVVNPDLIAWAHLIRLLAQDTGRNAARGYTFRELAEETGLNYLTVCRYVSVLHQVGTCYVSGYEPDGRGAFTIRRFKLGSEPDAPTIVRTRVERQREQRKRERFQKGKLP